MKITDEQIMVWRVMAGPEVYGHEPCEYDDDDGPCSACVSDRRVADALTAILNRLEAAESERDIETGIRIKAIWAMQAAEKERDELKALVEAVRQATTEKKLREALWYAFQRWDKDDGSIAACIHHYLCRALDGGVS